MSVSIEDHIGAVFEAVQQCTTAAYGAQEPAHFGSVIRWQDGGPDPLDGISVYFNPEGPFYHYVTSGMAEHGEKLSGIPEISGWGFELTLRLAMTPEVAERARSALADGSMDAHWLLQEAPNWPIPFFNVLGQYVFENQRPFRHGEYMEQTHASFLPRIAFLRDPAFPMAATPNGRFDWLQIVTLDPAQMERIKGDRWPELVTEMRDLDPLLLISADTGPTQAAT